MATLVSKATGNFTAAGTWGVGEAGAAAIQTTRSASTNTTGSYVYSSAFTVTNLDVIDGVVLYGRRLNTTGTITIAISDDNGVTATKEVTVNASDLSADDSTHFFLFPSTLTGDGGADYKIGIKASSANNAAFYRDGTAGNWFRIPRTTTTAAPGAADLLYINGELTGAGTGNSFTVTMDNTATTTFGTVAATSSVGVGVRGTLLWGTTASTAYVLKVAGLVNIFGGGTWQQGTSGTPMPATSSATLSFDCTTNVDSGLVIENGGTFEARGATKTVVSTLLTADEAAASTVIDVAATTDWAAGDVLGFASTTRTYSQYETKAIQTVDSGVQVTLAAGLTNAHSGTSPTQAEVVNLTRNVVITGESATLQGYIRIKATASFTAAYVEITFMGSSTTDKRGINTETTSGTFSLSYCSIHDFRVNNSGFLVDAGAKTGTWAVDNCVFYKATHFIAFWGTTSTGWSFTNNTAMGTDNGSGFNGAIAISNGAIGTFTGNRLSSCNDACIIYLAADLQTAFSNNVIHSNSGIGLSFNPPASSVITGATLSTLTIWRNASYGIQFQGSMNWVRQQLTTVTLFGNTTANIFFTAATISYLQDCIWDGIVSSGDTSFATATGIDFSGARQNLVNLKIRNSTFGVVSGIKTAHTQDFNAIEKSVLLITFENCNLASATPILNQSSMQGSSYLAHEKWQQTAGSHRRHLGMGTRQIDSVIFRTASPSQRVTPLSASKKMESGPWRVTATSGGTRTVSIYVRKSGVSDAGGADYNGNQPRLVLRANPALGVNSDTVIDTMTAGLQTWEQLTGATPTATGDNGVWELFVDCDGTAGWISVDDRSVV